MINAPRIWNLEGVAHGTGIVLVALLAFVALMVITGETESLLGGAVYFGLLLARLLVYLFIAPRLLSIDSDDISEAL